jgi:PadR family transcriptional regulator PadR
MPGAHRPGFSFLEVTLKYPKTFVSKYIYFQYILVQYIVYRYYSSMSKTTNARKQGVFLILLALLDGPKHGYEIAKYIETRSNGFFRMPFGTLYPILHRLESEAMLSSESDGMDGDRGKKTYKLTGSGKKYAQGEVSEFQLFSKTINRMVPG